MLLTDRIPTFTLTVTFPVLAFLLAVLCCALTLRILRLHIRTSVRDLDSSQRQIANVQAILLNTAASLSIIP